MPCAWVLVLLCLLVAATAQTGTGSSSSAAAPSSSAAVIRSSSSAAAATAAPVTPGGSGDTGGNPLDIRCAGSTVVPDNGALGTCGSSVAAGASCSVTCNEGFTVQGAARQCPATGGTLTGTDQTCLGEPCAAPTAAPENGASGTCNGQLPHGTSCAITCNEGFHVVGGQYKCFGGVLTGAQSCEGDKCPPQSTVPDNGGLGTCGGGGENIAHGTTCSVSCNSGYSVKGEPRTCTGGKWSGAEQTCEGNPCAALGAAPQHGQLGTCGSEVAHGATCSFSCEQGYELKGAQSRQCTAGAWAGAEQTCEGLPCGPITGVVENGELSTCGTQISHGGTCSISCHKGYHIKGANVRTCTAAVLEGEPQVCEGDPCAAIVFSPENGNVGTCGAEIQHGATCEITCGAGYHKDGAAFACTAGVLGVSAGGAPQSCKGDSCGGLASPPENGQSDSCARAVAHHDSCSILCNPGFKLADTSPKVRRCVAGKYVDAEQICVVDPGYQAVQDMRAGFANINAVDAKAAADTKSIADEKAIRERVLKNHAEEVERMRKIMYPPKPWDNVQPAPHSYKPIDIQNKYTYDRFYMPPETSTDQKVLSSAKELLGGLDALHVKRVETMEAKCKEPTCEVPALTPMLIQDSSEKKPSAADSTVLAGSLAPETPVPAAAIQLNDQTLLRKIREVSARRRGEAVNRVPASAEANVLHPL